MPQREFANQKALIDYAEQNGLAYLWEGMPSFGKRQRLRSPMPAFTKRQQQLSPEQYEIVDVRTSRGMRRAMLFPKAILDAEWAADAPLRDTPSHGLFRCDNSQAAGVRFAAVIMQCR